jgi:hypothetical protein
VLEPALQATAPIGASTSGRPPTGSFAIEINDNPSTRRSRRRQCDDFARIARGQGV